MIVKVFNSYLKSFLGRAIGGSTMGKYAKCIGAKMKHGKTMKQAHKACQSSKKGRK
jgi:hypothetical protein